MSWRKRRIKQTPLHKLDIPARYVLFLLFLVSFNGSRVRRPPRRQSPRCRQHQSLASSTHGIDGCAWWPP